MRKLIRRLFAKSVRIFAQKEDRTEINNLLAIVLNNKTTIESIKLKKQLDEEFKSILLEREQNNKKDNEAINNYLQ